ncbi:MAG: hypothetical protein K0R62_8379 [Nonomuraea muscovyensis]|nr:hypothetical protein [Nonomuraea muscovyensis]
MPTWGAIPAIDRDDVGLVLTAVVGATVTINRPPQGQQALDTGHCSPRCINLLRWHAR